MVVKIHLLVAAGDGEEKAYKAGADQFSIQFVGLLRKANVEPQMCTECLGEVDIQRQMSITRQFLSSFDIQAMIVSHTDRTSVDNNTVYYTYITLSHCMRGHNCPSSINFLIT